MGEELQEISSSAIVEVREDGMVDPSSCNANQNPTLRTAYFLKPSLNPSSLASSLPKIQSFSLPVRPNVVFLCGSYPLHGWQTWLQNLNATHEQTWRKAGIFDAIKYSTTHISKDPILIFSLAEKWCPETNTFVFPWGEATVTLEDVFVLFGFSPLGVSVLDPCSSLSDNVKQVEAKLINSHRKLMKIHPNVSHLRWQEYFMGCGDEIEHAGFLALWLARHVFPPKAICYVTQTVFSMAARLSCGVKYAFGPAILASIYRDLTLLKRKMAGYASDCHDGSLFKCAAPLHFVQVWAWERFPSLGPVPRMINCEEARLARWEHHKRNFCMNIDDIRMSLDSASDTFRWRPYATCLQNWLLPRFYVDLGMWVDVVSDEDMMVIARFLMVCQLVGLDCTQDYNPHRVALQFGFDQDIPEIIYRCTASRELDWLGYDDNLTGLKLYVPPRLHEGDVTYRYSKLWKPRLNPLEETIVRCKRKKITNLRGKRRAKIWDASDLAITMEKLPSLQVGNTTRMMTCALNMQVGIDSLVGTRMGNVEEHEDRKSNVTMSDNSNNFATVDGNVTVNPMEKLQPSEALEVVNVTRMMTSVLNMEIGVDSVKDPSLEDVEEINVTMCESSTCSDSNNTNDETVNWAEPLKDPIINCRMEGTASQVRPVIKVHLCSSVPCNECLNLANEVVQVTENNCNEGNAREEQNEGNLIGQKVNLGIDKSKSESLSECNGYLIRVASEVNTLNPILEEAALYQGTSAIHPDIPGFGKADVNNPFAALCVEFESRISSLEQRFSAFLAGNVTF